MFRTLCGLSVHQQWNEQHAITHRGWFTVSINLLSPGNSWLQNYYLIKLKGESTRAFLIRFTINAAKNRAMAVHEISHQTKKKIYISLGPWLLLLHSPMALSAFWVYNFYFLTIKMLCPKQFIKTWIIKFPYEKSIQNSFDACHYRRDISSDMEILKALF